MTMSTAVAANRLRRQSGMPINSEVRLRILSARRLRAKTMQNELADAQQTIEVSAVNCRSVANLLRFTAAISTLCDLYNTPVMAVVAEVTHARISIYLLSVVLLDVGGTLEIVVMLELKIYRE